MKINKSTRHSKIAGDFAEALVLYWLSKYGFECASVDHTGIDLIARNPHTQELMGISVKCRSRSTGAESEHLRIAASDFDKVREACEAFECVSYFALVIDAAGTITGFVLPTEHLLEMHPLGETSCSWSMSPKWLVKYEHDSQVMRFVFHTETTRWWGR